MPLIGTSGALSINKVFLSTTDNYWYLQWTTANTSPQLSAISSSGITIDNSNQVALIGATRNPAGSTSQWMTTAINQDYGNVNISWQNSFSNISVGTSLGDVLFFNKDTNIYYSAGSIVDSSSYTRAGTLIYNKDGSIVNAYVDDSNINGATVTYPWLRRPSSIVSDSAGDYWIAGVVNQKTSPTVNNYKIYYTKYSGSTKVYAKVLDSVGTLDSANYPTIELTNTGNILLGADVSTGVASTEFYQLMNIDSTTNAINWQLRLNRPSGSTISSEVSSYSDNLDNVYLVSYITGGATAGVYIQKVDSTGALQWQRKITLSTGTFLPRNISFDDDNNLYLLVIDPGATRDEDYIIKINSAGTLQWQRKLTTITANSIQAQQIKWFRNNLYLTTSAPNNTYSVIKLPGDGTIPGTGTYVVSGTITLSYTTTTNISISTGSPGTITTGSASISNAVSTTYTSLTPIANTTISTSIVSSLS